MTVEGIRIALTIVIIIFGLMGLPLLLKVFFKRLKSTNEGMILLAYIIIASITAGLIFG